MTDSKLGVAEGHSEEAKTYCLRVSVTGGDDNVQGNRKYKHLDEDLDSPK